jgi:hypothetical protein
LYSKPLSADEFIVAFREEHAIRIWALKFKREYQIFEGALQSIEMLLELADAPVIAPKILSGLEETQMVLLLSATTVTRQDFSPPWASCLNPEDWSEEEKAKFTSKFTNFMPGEWRGGDIINSWKKLLKVSWREKLALRRG